MVVSHRTSLGRHFILRYALGCGLYGAGAIFTCDSWPCTGGDVVRRIHLHSGQPSEGPALDADSTRDAYAGSPVVAGGHGSTAGGADTGDGSAA